MQELLVLAMEREEMPTSDNPPLTGRAKARQTVKWPWPRQEAAKQAVSTDNQQQPMAVVRVLAMAVVRESVTAVAKVVAKVVAKAVAKAEVMAVAKAAAMAVATEPPSNRNQKN